MTHMDHDLHANKDEGCHDKPVAPLAGIIYGDLVYWNTNSIECY